MTGPAFTDAADVTLVRRDRSRTVAGMRTLRRYGRPASGSGRMRRAASMLEFAFILPIFMFMLMFTLDMGHMVLMSGAMQDATFSAARTGAQVGGAAIDSTTGTTPCAVSGGLCEAGSTWHNLTDSASQIPGTGTNVKVDSMTIVHGGICRNNGVDDHVEIKVTYSVDLITPGLTSMLNMFSSGHKSSVGDGAWTMTSTAVARCEVIRSTS